MKKLSILFAAVAMIAMTACNEKPAKEAQAPETKVEATQQADTAKNKAIVGVEKVKPTEDGKDHTTRSEILSPVGTLVLHRQVTIATTRTVEHCPTRCLAHLGHIDM